MFAVHTCIVAYHIKESFPSYLFLNQDIFAMIYGELDSDNTYWDPSYPHKCDWRPLKASMS